MGEFLLLFGMTLNACLVVVNVVLVFVGHGGWLCIVSIGLSLLALAAFRAAQAAA